MKTIDVYREIEISSEVTSASNVKLIQLLLQKCMTDFQLAKKYISEKNIYDKHRVITNAIEIINHLRHCLVFNEETESFSKNLDSIYNHLEKCLYRASLTNDAKYIDHAEEVLTNIKSSWDKL